MSNNMKGHSRWLDMDYTVTVILKSATIDIYLDKLYAKHWIMNIHEGKNGKYDSSYTAGYNSRRQHVQ